MRLRDSGQCDSMSYCKDSKLLQGFDTRSDCETPSLLFQDCATSGYCESPDYDSYLLHSHNDTRRRLTLPLPTSTFPLSPTPSLTLSQPATHQFPINVVPLRRFISTEHYRRDGKRRSRDAGQEHRVMCATPEVLRYYCDTERLGDPAKRVPLCLRDYDELRKACELSPIVRRGI